MSISESKAQGGIGAVLTNFDICGMFDMVGFSASFFSKKTDDTWTDYNSGARFKGVVLNNICLLFSPKSPGIILRRPHPY